MAIVELGKDSSGRRLRVDESTRDKLAYAEHLLGKKLTIVQGSYMGTGGAAASAATEVWLPVVGYEGYYEVSSIGRVRSLTRRVPSGQGRTRIARGRVLSPYSGDRYVKVRLTRDTHGLTCNVHTLVANAFIGPRPDGLEVCHNNGQAHDNRVSNLRYDTHAANQRDVITHGGNTWSKRTHCNSGHEFTPENTRSRGPNESGRRCGVCEDARNKRRWQEELRQRVAV